MDLIWAHGYIFPSNWMHPLGTQPIHMQMYTETMDNRIPSLGIKVTRAGSGGDNQNYDTSIPLDVQIDKSTATGC